MIVVVWVFAWVDNSEVDGYRGEMKGGECGECGCVRWIVQGDVK